MGRDASWLHARIGRTVYIDNGQQDCTWQLVAVRGPVAVFENSDEPDLLVPHAEARAMLEANENDEPRRMCEDCGLPITCEELVDRCMCINEEDL